MSAVREVKSVLPRRSARRLFGLNALEIIATLLTLAFFGVALFYYMTTLGPHQNRLQDLESRRNALEAELLKVRAEAAQPAPVDTTEAALESLDTFKSRHLKPISQGEIALYRDINALSAKHSVQLISGVGMKREGVEKVVRQKQTKSKENPLADIYPHTVVKFSVAGQYNELRAFLSELERNQQFVIINSVSLSQVEQQVGEEGGGRRSRAARQSAIELAVDMTAYFRP